jgi:septum formation protein
MSVPTFILASASPARLQLLASVGINAIAQPSHFDESQVQSTLPIPLVETLAREKARAIAVQRSSPGLVLGCDSILALGDEIHGKPASPVAAIKRWQTMRRRTGILYTGHALIDLTSQRELVRHQATEVDFADVSDAQIAAYVATGEPLQCAGCFALDGRGGLFITQIRGCHSNVIGLSLPLLREMLQDLGYNISDYWS